MGLIGSALGTIAGQLIGRTLLGMMETPDSPKFELSNASDIAASGKDVINFEDQDPKIRKWLPFNVTVITNNSAANDLIIGINQTDSRRLNRGNEILVREALRSVSIENLGSQALAAGELTVVGMRR